MSFAFFIYTIIILGVGLITVSVSLMAWLMTLRRDCLVAAAGFLFYVLDTAVIFFDEYTKAKYADGVFSEPLQHPWLRCALALGILVCIWVWTLMRLRKQVTPKTVAVFIVPLLALQLLLVPDSAHAGRVQQYFYWLSRDLGIVACFAYAAWYYRKKSSAIERLDLDRSRLFFIVGLILTMLIIVEDTVMIMVLGPAIDSMKFGDSDFFWYLSERNISENFLYLAAALQLFQRYSHMFRVFSQHPQDVDEAVAENDTVNDDIASRIVIFADAHGLSAREQEVFAAILRGGDVQNIASELVISAGTVKAHMHRIYVKTGVSGRDELVRTFWKS